MNRKQRRIAGSQNQHKQSAAWPQVQWRGRAYTVDEAAALAMQSHSRGDLQAAIELYRDILAAVPGHADICNNLGVALTSLNRPEDAVICYSQAIALKPDFAAFYYNRGSALMTLKRHADALADYDKAIALKADYAEAHNDRGVVLSELGRQDDALKSYDKAIALKADYVSAYGNRAVTLNRMGRHDAALATLDKGLIISPDNVNFHNSRCVLLMEMGRYDESLAGWEKAIKINPNHAPFYNNRCAVLLEMHRYEEALATLNQAIALKPGYAEAWNNRGIALQKMKRYEESLTSCNKAIALKADYANAYSNRGIALYEMKHFKDALAAYDKAVALDPANAEAWNNRSTLLQELKLYKEALADSDKAIALNPNYAEAYNNRGVILTEMGEMQEAERMLVKALALNPASINALFSLTNIRRYKNLDHPDVKILQTLLENTPPSLPGRDCLYFALGKIFDECKHYDEAFAYYRQGNQILGGEVSYNPRENTESTDAAIAVFTKDFLAQEFPFSSSSRTPVFIVGMPRSGTTLMASILSNHPSVGSAGELPTLTEFCLRMPELSPYPQSLAHLAPAIAARLAEDYEKRLRRDIGPDKPYVIDKHPLNFRHLGLITMLFPKAHIIHCLRHPLDTGLSNYFQRFDPAYNYSFDLANIGQYYGEYARLMEHWQKVLPTPMLEIHYEDMTADTETIARRMLDFLGLEWNERCLSPHTNPNPVETASSWQVRQPIYKKSVARWRHYEKHLGPLKEALERAGQWP